MKKGLNSCRQACDHFSFYKSCANNIRNFLPLQFNYVNKINIYICYSYLTVLQDFTLVKETVVAYVYHVINIIKLRVGWRKCF